jgi:hypothetical protein
MNRPNSTLRGKPRKRDCRGEVHGPYRVIEYVGNNPMTPEFVRLECALGCGHRVTCEVRNLSRTSKTKRCGGRKVAVVRMEAAE